MSPREADVITSGAIVLFIAMVAFGLGLACGLAFTVVAG